MTLSLYLVELSMKDLKDLPPPEKKVAAKALIENGYSSRKVEELLGIDHSSAINYSQEIIPEEMKEFSTIFDNYIQESKKKGIAIGLKRLNELMPKEEKIPDLVKGLEFLEGKESTNNNLTQINIGKEMSIEFE